MLVDQDIFAVEVDGVDRGREEREEGCENGGLGGAHLEQVVTVVLVLRRKRSWLSSGESKVGMNAVLMNVLYRAGRCL